MDDTWVFVIFQRKKKISSRLLNFPKSLNNRVTNSVYLNRDDKNMILHFMDDIKDLNVRTQSDKRTPKRSRVVYKVNIISSLLTRIRLCNRGI